MPAIDEVSLLENVANYTARAFRRLADYGAGEGVTDYGSYRVTFSAGLSLTVAPGIAFVRGNSLADQGVYRCTNLTNRTVTLPAADATNPRIDSIVLQVQDAAEDAGSGNQGQVTVIQGTATAGATLDNRAGAANLTTQTSPTLILLADVLVNAGNSPALSSSSIRDRRPMALDNVPSPALTGRSMVILEPLASYNVGPFGLTGTAYATRQSAYAAYLPSRIPATHFRWKYHQDVSNPVASGQNWNMGLADASGRIICQTGNVAFAGAAGTYTQVARAFSPTLPAGFMFEAGVYFIMFGISGLTAAQAFGFMGWRCDPSTGINETPSVPGLVFRGGAAGTTFDASGTILNMTDLYNDVSTATVVGLPVPQAALSIG